LYFSTPIPLPPTGGLPKGLLNLIYSYGIYMSNARENMLKTNKQRSDAS
jgi:hypothetical protein